MSIRISAVICTHNRASFLRSALRSLMAQTLDPSAYEILIVDNASTDDTRSVVDGERHAQPLVRYVHEGTVGVSRARNAGWRNARAALVAYLDLYTRFVNRGHRVPQLFNSVQSGAAAYARLQPLLAPQLGHL